MGQTVINLASKKLSGKPIFPNRFVVEICEKIHTHYKNLRLVNSLSDWVTMAEGFRDALDRWKKRGCPGTSKARHIELCRKKVFTESDADTILINLNKNLYPDHEGMIFAEGSEFNDLHYVHLKIRDCRVELSIKDFKELADAVQEAGKRLKEGDICALLQKA